MSARVIQKEAKVVPKISRELPKLQKQKALILSSQNLLVVQIKIVSPKLNRFMIVQNRIKSRNGYKVIILNKSKKELRLVGNCILIYQIYDKYQTISKRFQNISKFPVIIDIKAMANNIYKSMELNTVVVDEMRLSEAVSQQQYLLDVDYLNLEILNLQNQLRVLDFLHQLEILQQLDIQQVDMYELNKMNQVGFRFRIDTYRSVKLLEILRYLRLEVNDNLVDQMQFGVGVKSVKIMDGYQLNEHRDGPLRSWIQFHYCSTIQVDEHPSNDSILASSHYSLF